MKRVQDSQPSERQHFLDRRPKDWHGFFAACGEDPVLAHVARLVECLDADLHVIVLTARPIWVREATTAWLARFDVRWNLLVMREEGDYRSRSRATVTASGDTWQELGRRRRIGRRWGGKPDVERCWWPPSRWSPPAPAR